MERFIAGLWREALGIEAVGVRDNFFDIGGHSLLAMRVLAQVQKRVGRRMNPREMIFQTLEQLAASLDREAPAIAPVVPRSGLLGRIVDGLKGRGRGRGAATS